MPRTPFIGVRISWLTLARNSDFSRAASSASSRATTSCLRPPALHELAEEARDRHHRGLDLGVARMDGVVEELEHAQARPVAHHRDARGPSGMLRGASRRARRSSCCASCSHTSARVSHASPARRSPRLYDRRVVAEPRISVQHSSSAR